VPYLIAELEGYIVGYSYAAPFRPREGYRSTVEDSIYVRADCKGHGVRKTLLTELISRCQARACHSMVACICGINLPSVALHASLGFAPIGTLPEAGEEVRKVAEPFDHAEHPLTKYRARFSLSPDLQELANLPRKY
jgi:L-amino acid N-acyltransferase YncA